MAAHSPTPAPWIAKRAGQNTYTRVFANEAGGEWLVAQCHEWCNGGYGPSREESEANARLIAAAPDLLVLAEIFLGGDERYQVAVGGNPIAVDKMLADARATIAKAKGAP